MPEHVERGVGFGWRDPLAMGWLGLIIVAGFVRIPEGVPDPGGIGLTDKHIHFFIYMIWGALLFWRGGALWWIPVAVFISLAQEASQCLTPHRQFEWLDVLCNALGIVTGAGIIRRWRRGSNNTANLPT